jgi:hypothetical protein
MRDHELPTDIQWRITWMEKGRKRGTDWRAWISTGAFKPGPMISADRSVRFRATCVIANGDGFLLGLGNPPAVIAISEKGAVVGSELALVSEPVGMAIQGNRLAVVTRAGSPVQEIDLKSWRLARSMPFDRAHAQGKQSPAEFSFRPASVAYLGQVLWIGTERAQQDGAIFFLRPGERIWRLPDYVDGFNFSLGDLRLHPQGEVLLGIESKTQPTTIYAFTEDSIVPFRGHKHEDVSEGQDLACLANGEIMIFGHDNELLQVKLSQPGVDRIKSWRTDVRKIVGPNTWEDDLMALSGENLAAAFSAENTETGKPVQLQVAVFDKNGRSRMVIAAEKMGAASLAATPRALALVAFDSTRQRQAYIAPSPWEWDVSR